MNAALRHTPLALALALIGQSAFAQDTTVIAPTVVITGTRVEQNSFDLPMAIDSIDRTTIQDQRATVNLSEVINRVPGVAAAGKENYTQEQSLTIRGFGARSQFGVRGVKLFADGIPASTPDGQGGTGLFDLASASRIEVLRGPFSALYGNHSGGVVQVFTEDGPDRFTVTPSFQAGSYGTTRYGLKFGDTVGNFNYTGSVSRFDTEGYRDYSASQKEQANFKAKWQLADRTTLTAVGNYMAQSGQDPLGLTLAQLKQDRRQEGIGNKNVGTGTASEFGTRRSLNNTQGGFVLDTALNDIDSLRAVLYLGNRSNSQFLAINSTAQNNIRAAGALSEFDRDYWGANLRWTRKLETVTFSLGAEYERSDERRLGFRTDPLGTDIYGQRGSLKRNETNTAEQKGVYLQGEWAATDAFSLSAGARYTHVKFDSNDRFICTTIGVPCSGSSTAVSATAFNPDDSGSVSYNDWTSALGALWKITPTTNLYANVGQSFEAPTLAEISYRPNQLESGLNFNLKPSTSTQYEIGVKSFVTDSTRIDASVFMIDTKNEIVVFNNASGRVSYQNAGDTSRYGAELSIDSRVTNKIGAFGALTLLNAEFDDSFLTCAVARCAQPPAPPANPNGPVTVNSGNKIAAIANKTFYGELTYNEPSLGFNGAIELRASGRMYADDTNTARVGGFTVTSLRGGFTQKVGGWKFNEFLRVDNLFDKEYVGSVYVNDANGRYYAPAAERSWLIGLSASYSL